MTTINKEEIQKFSKLASEWWDVEGKFKPLHMFNPIRIEYILEFISKHFKKNKDNELPLKNLKILDIGCGGGLISEPMYRIGSRSYRYRCIFKNIKLQKVTQRKQSKIKYLNKSPEQLFDKEKI